WWPDSNRRPAHYECAALPAELHQRLCQSITYGAPAGTPGTRLRGCGAPLFYAGACGPSSLALVSRPRRRRLFHVPGVHGPAPRGGPRAGLAPVAPAQPEETGDIA